MTTFNETYDTATPADSDDPAEADDRMREIKAAVQERENVDHIWDKTGTEVSGADTGEHRKVLFHAPIATTPTVAADHGDLRIKDVANGADTKAELVFTNEAEAEVQLTANGKNLANNVNLTGDNAAGDAAVNLVKANTSDLAELSDGAVLAAATEVGDGDRTIADKAYADAGNPYIKISDVKVQGASGGDFTSGAWQTRVLNTEDTDTGSHAALNSNQITLDAGTYECRIMCPGRAVDGHQARLRNTTAGTTLLTGTSAYSGATDAVNSHSVIVGRFTVAANQVLEVQHRCQSTLVTTGFGLAVSVGSEVYTVAEFWKR